MHKPFIFKQITNENAYYTSRSDFSLRELLPHLPEEMMQAQKQIFRASCHGRFYTNHANELRCKLKPPNNVSIYYTWNPHEKQWELD